MNALGIDPGKSGALVLLGPTGELLSKEVMPTDAEGTLDRNSFISTTEEWHNWDDFHIFLERVIPFALNAKGALAFGRQLGMIEQIIWERSWSVTLVEASKWSKEIHQGIDSRLKPKEKSLIAASRLFPKVDLTVGKGKKPHDGLVDALLIAEWGRRNVLS